MNTQAEVSATPIGDVVKQVLSGLLLVSGIAAFYYFSDIQLLYRVLALVLVFAAAIGLLFTTTMGHDIWGFIKESKQEVRKVVWPTREETIHTTMMVFAMVFVTGLLLWLLDMFLFWVVRLLTGQGV